MQYHEFYKGESYEFSTSNSMFSHGKKYQYCIYLFFFIVQKKASQTVIDLNPEPSPSKVIRYRGLSVLLTIFGRGIKQNPIDNMELIYGSTYELERTAAT